MRGAKSSPLRLALVVAIATSCGERAPSKHLPRLEAIEQSNEKTLDASSEAFLVDLFTDGVIGHRALNLLLTRSDFSNERTATAFIREMGDPGASDLSDVAAIASKMKPAPFVALAPKLLENSNPRVRAGAFIILAEAGQELSREQILVASGSPSSNVRRAAITAMEQARRSRGESYIPQLVVLLGNESQRTQFMASAALRDYAAEASDIVAEVRLGMDDQHLFGIGIVVWGMVESGDAPGSVADDLLGAVQAVSPSAAKQVRHLMTRPGG